MAVLTTTAVGALCEIIRIDAIDTMAYLHGECCSPETWRRIADDVVAHIDVTDQNVLVNSALRRDLVRSEVEQSLLRMRLDCLPHWER